MTKDEALRLALEALEKLWGIIDDIDTYGDMAKADEKLYRTLVERRQRQRFEETGISTDGYELHGGAITAIKAALEAKDEPVEQPEVRTGNCLRVGVCASEGHKIQPQRTLIGLTAEERQQVQAESYGKVPHYVALIAAVEAKLRSKNGY